MRMAGCSVGNCRDDHRIADRPFYGWIPKSCRFAQGTRRYEKKTKFVLKIETARRLFWPRKSLSCRLGCQNHSRHSDEHKSNLPALRLARLPPSLIVRGGSTIETLGNHVESMKGRIEKHRSNSDRWTRGLALPTRRPVPHPRIYGFCVGHKLQAIAL